MIKKWYHPSNSGDFRLEAVGDEECTLTIVDPTAGEIVTLGKFMEKCRKKGWIDPLRGLPHGTSGTHVLELAAPLSKAGRILVGRGQGIKRKDLLTVVKSEKDTLTFVISDEEGLAQAVEAKGAKSAVSNKRATLCCPHPISGPDIRASEVLREFCTQRQWDDWNDYGFLIAYGKRTGHPYRIAHRHTALAAKQGKIAWDMADGHVVHCYDWSMPPAEEVLSVKLQLEHVEHWIRNPSGYFGPDPIFINPFMSEEDQGQDGVPDSSFLMGLGEAMPILAAQVRQRGSE